MLRSGKVEAYVLHTKYGSVVTVGGYDTPDDPRLRQMQERFARLSQDPNYARLEFLATPVPMPVPR
jgi:hypothetical protein